MTDTETQISLDLSEFEASILVGALEEFAEKWDSGTAQELLGRVRRQLPEEWKR